MDMWIMEALGPYTKESPSTRCTSLRLVTVDFRGSIPAAVNGIMNVDNECWDGERSNWS